MKVQDGRISKNRCTTQQKKQKQAALAKNLAGFQQILPSNGDQQFNITYANFKVIKKEKASAVQFANEIAETSPTALETSLGPRIVFFPDGSGAGPRGINGAGVTYRLHTSQTTDWIDASAGILGKANHNDAELIAVGMALNIAKCELQAIHQLASGRQVTYPTIFIITDSTHALHLLREYIPCNITVAQIKRLTHKPSFTQLLSPLDQFQRLGVKVEFHWTKAHDGVYGNNRADRLAGKAARGMVAKVGYNNVPRFAKDPYKIHMTPETAPHVEKLFQRLLQDQKEDIALLLENAHPSQLNKVPILPQGDQGDGGLLAGHTEGLGNPEESDKKGSRPAEKLKKMMSPLKGLIQTVTGQKRKHEETADSDSNPKKLAGGKMAQYLSRIGNKLARSHSANTEVIDLTNDDEDEENSTKLAVSQNAGDDEDESPAKLAISPSVGDDKDESSAKLAIPQNVGDDEDESPAKLATSQNIDDDEDESSSKLAISQNIGDNEGESSSKSAKSQNIDIEAIDLAGGDEEESSSKTGYVIRYEAGREVIDLTEA